MIKICSLMRQREHQSFGVACNTWEHWRKMLIGYRKQWRRGYRRRKAWCQKIYRCLKLNFRAKKFMVNNGDYECLKMITEFNIHLEKNSCKVPLCKQTCVTDYFKYIFISTIFFIVFFYNFDYFIDWEIFLVGMNIYRGFI